MVSAEAARSCREQVQGQTDAAPNPRGRLQAGRKPVFPSSKQQHAKEGEGRESSLQMEEKQLCHSPLQEHDGQMKDEFTSASPVRCF